MKVRIPATVLLIGSMTLLLCDRAMKDVHARGSQTAPSEDTRPSDTVVFKTSFGPVTFFHAKHQDFAPQQCVTCHHKTEQETNHACRACHKRSVETNEGDPPSFSAVKMKFCRGCHAQAKEKDQNSKAPVACEGCHDVKRS